MKARLLDKPRRLPRPLSDDQVSRLEEGLLKMRNEAKNQRKKELAIRDLACFYLLWHCGMRISEVCSLLVTELDLEGRKIFIRNGKAGKDRVVYMGDTAVIALRQQLASRQDTKSPYLFPTRQGILNPRSLQRRLVLYGQIRGVPVTAQRLRHTFASQMLASGMPVTSLQRYLGHKNLDNTMLYAEVADPLLRQDYYQGITTLDPATTKPIQPGTKQSLRKEIHQLVEELKTTDLAPHRQREIVA